MPSAFTLGCRFAAPVHFTVDLLSSFFLYIYYRGLIAVYPYIHLTAGSGELRHLSNVAPIHLLRRRSFSILMGD